MKKLGFVSAAVVVAGGCVAASPASALTDTQILSGLKYDGYVAGHQSVGYGGTSLGTGSANAGGFYMSDNPGDHDFLAWCLNITGTIYSNSSYDYRVELDDPFTNDPLSSGNRQNYIESMWDSSWATVKSTIFDPLETAATKKEYSVAWGLALWEIVNETSGTFNISNGSGTWYVTSGASSAIIGLANTFLTGLSSSGSYASAAYLDKNVAGNKLVEPSYQNLMTENPDFQAPNVPLPAAGWLLAGGLMALFGIGRRKKPAQNSVA